MAGLSDSAAAAHQITSPPRQPVEAPEDTVQEGDTKPMELGDKEPAAPPFEPVFTLLTNTTTNTTIHPRVHYIFSDDDESSVLAAAHTGSESDRPGDATVSDHCALIVDLAPDAATHSWSVTWASSLSSRFAVTTTDLSKQQSGSSGNNQNSSHNNSGSEGDNGNGNLILRIEGVSRDAINDSRPSADSLGNANSLPGSGSGSGALLREDVPALVEEFRRRMGVMGKVVDAGELRRKAVQGDAPEGEEKGERD